MQVLRVRSTFRSAAMSQCPNCHTENMPNTRFCAECGVRLDSSPAALAQPGQAQINPARTTGKETIVLHAPEPTPAEPLSNQAAPVAAYTDATLVDASPVPAVLSAADKTILAGLPPAPSSAPTSALPAPPQNPALAVPTLPIGTFPANQPAGGSRSRIWLILGL